MVENTGPLGSALKSIQYVKYTPLETFLLWAGAIWVKVKKTTLENIETCSLKSVLVS